MFLSFQLGLLLGLGIIVSIGAQNIFVIKQGIKQEHPYLSAFVCFLCDVVLIVLGVTSVSALFIYFPSIKTALLVLGILFLSVYGSLSLRTAFSGKRIQANIEKINQGLKLTHWKIILLALSFSLLNPQAILDTMVIIGGTASHYAQQVRLFFVAGTIAGSFLWFTGLSITTTYFSRFLLNIGVWRGLEFMSGTIMWLFAIKFFLQLVA